MLHLSSAEIADINSKNNSSKQNFLKAFASQLQSKTVPAFLDAVPCDCGAWNCKGWWPIVKGSKNK